VWSPTLCIEITVHIFTQFLGGQDFLCQRGFAVNGIFLVPVKQ
jgi:hypothetical protein